MKKFLIVNPGSIKVIPLEYIEEGRAIRNKETGEVYMNPTEYECTRNTK